MKRAIIHSFNNEIIRKIIAVISAAIVARFLGPVGKGQYAIITYYATISFSVLSIGFSNAQLYLVRIFSLDKVSTNVLFLAACLGIIACGISMFVGSILENLLFRNIDFLLVVLGLSTIPIKLLTLSLRRVLQSKNEIKRFNNLKLVEPTVFLFLVLVYSVSKLDLKDVVLAYSMASIVNLGITTFFVRQVVCIKKSLIEWSVVKSIVSYIVRIGPGGLLGLFQYRLDVFIIAYLLDSQRVGIYVAGMALAEIVWRVPAAIVNVLQPKIVSITDDEAKDITSSMFRLTFIFVSILCILIFFLGRNLVLLFYGNEFLESHMILRYILPGVLFISLWKILINDLNARGFPHYYSLSAIVGLLILIVLDFILINKFDLIGAALASTVSYLCSLIVIVIFYLRNTSQSFSILIPSLYDLAKLRNLLK